jgi:hypothetical protein
MLLTAIVRQSPQFRPRGTIVCETSLHRHNKRFRAGLSAHKVSCVCGDFSRGKLDCIRGLPDERRWMGYRQLVV